MKKIIPLYLTLSLLSIFIFPSFSCKKEKINYTPPAIRDTTGTVMTDTATVDSTRTDTTLTDTATVHTDTVYTFLALGDSYTIGQNVPGSERFPAQTVSMLSTKGLIFSAPQYVAATGWTTTNLLSAIAVTQPTHHFDVVTLLIGVNDQFQHLDTAGYAARFEQLLNEAISFANNQRSHVFVLSIPDYSVTPFVYGPDKGRISMEIDWFNAINKRITGAYNIDYTDITPSTRFAATDSSLIASDGLHPSGKEYKVWANLLAPKIFALLH